MEWKRCLYLERVSQNGRVVVELADPIIEFVGISPLEGIETDDPAGKAKADDEPIDQQEPAAGAKRFPTHVMFAILLFQAYVAQGHSTFLGARRIPGEE